MGIQNHIYHRGAAYIWRRRLPSHLGGNNLQISLRTNDALIARRLGVISRPIHGFSFQICIEIGLSFCRWDVLDWLEQAAAFEPVDPFQCGIFHGFEVLPSPTPVNELGLE